LQIFIPITSLLLACSLFGCRTSSGDKAAEPCGSFPEWSAETPVKTGDVYHFRGTPYVAAGDNVGQNPIDHVALWNAVPCTYTAAAGLESQAFLKPWKLVWSDEFEAATLDESKWTYEVQGPGWVNHELQNYTDRRKENVRLENGQLVIEGHRDFFEGKEFSSGRIKTQGKFNWAYGHIEARIQVPAGTGPWSAFWMMPEDCSRGWPACGEIDIMEHVGYEPNTVHTTFHSLSNNWRNGKNITASTNVDGATSSFHIYAIDWYPDRIETFVDGRRYFTSYNNGSGDDAWPFNKPYYLILNLAIGGDWGGAQGVDRVTIWPKKMLVDYVRVYQK